MARTITNIVPTGGGLRITWSDNRISQFVWKLIDGKTALTEDGFTVNTALLNEIIDATPKDFNSSTFWEHLFGDSGGAGNGTTGIDMAVTGELNNAGTLPVVRLGSEVAGKALVLTSFRGRRDVAGLSGTTTIQLEVNGIVVPGAILSWLSTDSDLTLKTALISESIVPGDLISFRLISRELNASNIFAEVD
jgi:hypothetical protein